MYDLPPPSSPPPPGPESQGRFTDIFIERPVLSLVVSLLILLVGLRAIVELPVREYPKLSNTVITVQTSYPGATADLMQGFITQPIEQSVASAEGLDYLTSSSSQGSSTITVYVKLNEDPNKALTEVISKVQQVKYLIPKEAYDPVITKETGDQFAAMYFGVYSKTMSNSSIADYLSRAVQPKLATVNGVAQAEILGGQNFAMRMWLDPQRMAAYGVTADDINNAITTNNFQSAPGQVKGYFTITDVTANTGLTTVEQFKQLVVKAKGDQLVRMQDIARVDLNAESYDSQIFMEGKTAVFIGIHVTPDGNPLDVSKGIRAILPDLQHNLPAGLEMKIQFDSTDFIRAAIKEVARTLIESLLIVVVIIFLFLGNLRAVLIPVVTIPLSLVGAGIIMAALGFSLNLLTLLAMVLAIGLVVDDAIVVVENVYRWMEKGKSPIQAALIGAREIAGPVIVMTLTLAAVYAPIGFLGGLTGALFKEFAFTLAGAVIISGIVALTLSPMMCSALLRHTTEQGRFARFIDRSFHRLTGFYARVLSLTLRNRVVVGFFAAMVFASAVFMFFNTKAELAPDEDQGIIYGIVKAPTYANIDYTAEAMERIDSIYRSFPETKTDFIIAGSGTVHDGIAGELVKPWGDRKRSVSGLLPLMQAAVTTQVPGVSTFLLSPPPLPGADAGLPIGFVISSTDDYRTIYQVMEDVKKAARASGLFIVIDSDLAFDSPVVNLKVDHSKANALGLSMQSVGNTLATMMGGNYVNRFSVNGRSYEVIPQVPRAERFNAEELGQYYVNSRSGQPIPLSSFVTAEHKTEPNALVQYNQLNSATLSLLTVPQVSMGQAIDFLNNVAKTTLPAGFFHDYVSESRQFTREGSQLNVTFAFALIMIFLVLAAQFESLRDPLVVLVTVPLSISGALIPLFFWIVSFNIYTQVGLITLIGLISKHGILMVEFARELQINEGMSRLEAIQRAAAVRLRPILMTTAAMVTGLLPLLIASGAGAASRLSIGIVIVFGMTIGTFFTLLVLPTVYTVLAKDHRADLRSVRRKEIAEVH